MKTYNSDKKEELTEQEMLDEIERLHETDQAASKKGDFATLITLLADGCVLLPPGRPPIIGKDAIWKYFQEQKEQLCNIEIIEYMHDFQEIKICGKWAFEWGSFSNAARPAGGGEVIRGKGKLFRILERQENGSWKVSRSIWNSDPVTQ
jgi:ketosteroid isomerase-like protein